MILLDLTHTSHTRARTGIQRVCRALHRELGSRGVATSVTWDPYAKEWRKLEPWELENLGAGKASPKRGTTWPVSSHLRGRFRKWRSKHANLGASPQGLIVPELFSADAAAAMPALFSGVAGPKVALFHDAIALKFPELSPVKTVARFPSYLQELARFDGIAAISADSRDTLLDYWRWLGLANTPPVETIPLGIDAPANPTGITPGKEPIVLCIGTIEGRKNHPALLEACERLWEQGSVFALRLVGLAQVETGKAALATIARLQSRGRAIRYDGPASDTELLEAYRECHFTVYPSLIEGFGLPVLESLAHGKPCICSAKGALGESAKGGGCIALEKVDAASLAPAIARLLSDEAEPASLSLAARERKLCSWSNYGDALLAWMNSL
ncbi:MAG: glycosyltransferase family 1 protein [Opitutaceae bacterium]|jgi:glycosyltransferase involved in cell wall biosynthesis